MSSDKYYKPQKAPIDAERILNETASEALRAGVVIFTLDMAGVTACKGMSPFEQHLPLSKKTGGTIVENSNFFLQGIKPAQEALRGYYLLSYIPPPGTFDKNRRETYHRARVRVKRSGSEVRSRDGFFDSSNTSNFVVAAQNNRLQQAIFSPFLLNDLKLSLASGYAHALAPGYFLRSWMHMEGKAACTLYSWNWRP